MHSWIIPSVPLLLLRDLIDGSSAGRSRRDDIILVALTLLDAASLRSDGDIHRDRSRYRPFSSNSRFNLSVTPFVLPWRYYSLNKSKSTTELIQKQIPWERKPGLWFWRWFRHGEVMGFGVLLSRE